MKKTFTLIVSIVFLFILLSCTQKETVWFPVETDSTYVPSRPELDSVTQFTDTFKKVFRQKIMEIPDIYNVNMTFYNTGSKIFITGSLYNRGYLTNDYFDPQLLAEYFQYNMCITDSLHVDIFYPLLDEGTRLISIMLDSPPAYVQRNPQDFFIVSYNSSTYVDSFYP
jgi:hypothetical protein